MNGRPVRKGSRDFTVGDLLHQKMIGEGNETQFCLSWRALDKKTAEDEQEIESKL